MLDIFSFLFLLFLFSFSFFSFFLSIPFIFVSRFSFSYELNDFDYSCHVHTTDNPFTRPPRPLIHTHFSSMLISNQVEFKYPYYVVLCCLMSFCLCFEIFRRFSVFLRLFLSFHGLLVFLALQSTHRSRVYLSNIYENDTVGLT